MRTATLYRLSGAYAVALAPGHGFAAASVNYGGCPENAVRALAGACSIAGSYGSMDRSPHRRLLRHAPEELTGRHTRRPGGR